MGFCPVLVVLMSKSTLLRVLQSLAGLEILAVSTGRTPIHPLAG